MLIRNIRNIKTSIFILHGEVNFYEEFTIKGRILSHRDMRDSKQQLLLSLRVSLYPEFRQTTVAMAYLCSVMSGASLGGLKG